MMNENKIRWECNSSNYKKWRRKAMKIIRDFNKNNDFKIELISAFLCKEVFLKDERSEYPLNFYIFKCNISFLDDKGGISKHIIYFKNIKDFKFKLKILYAQEIMKGR